MPKFTLDLSPTAVAGLQLLAGRYNADNGTTLSVTDWLHLHVKELAIQDDLVAAAKSLREQADRDADAAFNAERQRLLNSVT